jgi:cobalt/nickel transport system permease protein
MLAVALLGIPCAVISMALVLGVQAVFFGDGGINALGANVLNMALIGAAIGGMIFEFQKKKGVPFHAALAVASWVSVMAAAVACSVEVALSGTAAFSKVLPAMVSVHALIGAGEAVFTVALVVALLQCARAWKSNEAAVAFASFAVAVGAAFLSPFASNFPDGLEKVSQKLGFLSFGEMPFKAVFADYRLFSVTSEFWSTLGAGLAGTFIVLAASYITSRALKLGNREKASFSC